MTGTPTRASRLYVATGYKAHTVGEFITEYLGDFKKNAGLIFVDAKEGTFIVKTYLYDIVYPRDTGARIYYEFGKVEPIRVEYARAIVVSVLIAYIWDAVNVHIIARPAEEEQPADTVRLNPSAVSPKPSAGSPEAFGAKPLGPVTVAQYIEYLRTLDQDRRIWVVYDTFEAFTPIPDACYHAGEHSTGLAKYGVYEGDYLILT